MTPKHLCILLLALVAIGTAAGQSEDIPIENDNQFPPENPSESDGAVIEGSGGGALEETVSPTIETTEVPLLEGMQPTVLTSNNTTQSEDSSCPKPCLCHFENDHFVVDCAGYELTEFPYPIDTRTTTLNLQNNQIKEIPKDIAILKSLKVLNAENNSIMDLALGSVSELPELTVLKLGNNRLIEYPKDLKNSFSLTKLEELDLGGNDMRTELTSETFSNFQALRKLTVATSTPNLLPNLCASLKATLETVCTESCNKQFYECTDTPEVMDDDLIDATLPGMISFEGDDNTDIADPIINSANVETISTDTTDIPKESAENNNNLSTSDTTEEPLAANENVAQVASGRAMLSNVLEETTPQKTNAIVEASESAIVKSETDVKVGAATTETKTGGVDKSVIGIIVAAMVVVVAVITIKKNWSSIRKRFSSSPRPAERGGANANGTTPEEVPLQDKDKSPV